MIVKCINHKYKYNVEKLCTMFFPLEKQTTDGDSPIQVLTSVENNNAFVSARIFSQYNEMSCDISTDDDTAHLFSVMLYKLLSDMTGFTPPWGILYGVRPARLMHTTCEQLGEEQARDKFINYNLVSPQKTQLALDVMHHENKIIALSGKNSYSLYVSIPFCPSRCSYCSFVSHSIENAVQLIEPYTRLLCQELEKIAQIANSLSLQLESIYFGGGTPTSLPAHLMKNILDTIADNFDLSTLREYTVEAGRPDTVTEEKLSLLKSSNVSRISINPQTFNDDVLKKIGRRHTTNQTVDAFKLARSVGFDNINMDLIAGLDGDTLDSFKNSVDSAVGLGAESITVHNLSLKSGAFLVTNNQKYDLSNRSLASDMINYSFDKLSSENYYPYYMYRQSKSLGNLENVGWCKDGFDCLYNVFMMDETHSVFAAGAGAVTKLKNQTTGHIERVYNYKYPYEYINDFNEIINRKLSILDFYNE